MHELRHLQLFGNNLTNDGLQAILSDCPHLVSLDLRQCFSISLAGNSVRSCFEKIKDVRYPNDSTEDYGFDAQISDDDSWDDADAWDPPDMWDCCGSYVSNAAPDYGGLHYEDYF
ncbi:unnamed protein product [Ilex paraguariensis]|uniref:Uncharacterized protein n=1 Tax=Ilex paraguariensis TaxID=185542 RepID=A0ABC8UJE9_9AQUA